MSELFKAQRRVVGLGSAATGGIRDFTGRAIQANTSPRDMAGIFSGFEDIAAELKKNNDQELLSQEFDNFATSLTEDVATFESGSDPEVFRQRHLARIEAMEESMPRNVAQKFGVMARNSLRTQYGGVLAREYQASQERIFKEQKFTTNILMQDTAYAYANHLRRKERGDEDDGFVDFTEKLDLLKGHIEQVGSSSYAYNDPKIVENELNKLTVLIGYHRATHELSQLDEKGRKELIVKLETRAFKDISYELSKGGDTPDEVNALGMLPVAQFNAFLQRVKSWNESYTGLEKTTREYDKNTTGDLIATLLAQRKQFENSGDMEGLEKVDTQLRKTVSEFENRNPNTSTSEWIKQIFPFDMNTEEAEHRLANIQIASETSRVMGFIEESFRRTNPNIQSISHLGDEDTVEALMVDGSKQTIVLTEDQIRIRNAHQTILDQNVNSKVKAKNLKALAGSLKDDFRQQRMNVGLKASGQQARVLRPTLQDKMDLANTDPNHPALKDDNFKAGVATMALAAAERDPVVHLRHLQDADKYFNAALRNSLSELTIRRNASEVDNDETREKAKIRDWEKVNGIDPNVIRNLAAKLSQNAMYSSIEKTQMNKMRELVTKGLVNPSVIDALDQALASIDLKNSDEVTLADRGNSLRGIHSLMLALQSGNNEANFKNGVSPEAYSRWLTLDLIMRSGFNDASTARHFAQAFDPGNVVPDKAPDGWGQEFQEAFHDIADVRIFGDNFAGLPPQIQAAATRLSDRIRKRFPQLGSDPGLVAAQTWKIMGSEEGYGLSVSAEPLAGIADNPTERIGRHPIETHFPALADKMHFEIIKDIKANADFSKYLKEGERPSLTEHNAELGQTVWLRASEVTLIHGKLKPRYYTVVAKSGNEFVPMYRKDGNMLLIEPHMIAANIDKSLRDKLQKSHRDGIEQQRALDRGRRGRDKGSIQPLQFGATQ